ncbi:MAG: peptidylprolyl isomerase [Pseudomonadales bacterium]|nr:peptidylprolyl isomerase [Pseudomonadales bacterium]
MHKLKHLFVFILFCSTASGIFADNTSTSIPPIIESTATPGSAVQVLIKTNAGNIVVALNTEKAPISVKNFLAYVEEGFYEDVIFHRVMDGFMIQTGGFDVQLNRKQTHATIKNEATNGLKNLRGTLAMARTGVVDSATSQFFINLMDNQFLDNGVRGYGYAVFGKVIEGIDVVSRIGEVKTTRRGNFKNLPVDSITILSASVINNEMAAPPSAPTGLQVN